MTMFTTFKPMKAYHVVRLIPKSDSIPLVTKKVYS